MDLNIRQKLKDVVGEMLDLLEQGAANPNAPPLWAAKVQTAVTKARILHEVLRQNVASGDVFFFGVIGESDHQLFDSNLLPVTGFPKINITEIPAVIAAGIDGGLLPDTDTEGAARVQVIEGWSVISFHDRNADRRMGNHSTYVLRRTYPAEEGIAKAAELFPSVFARYPFSVVLQV